MNQQLVCIQTTSPPDQECKMLEEEKKPIIGGKETYSRRKRDRVAEGLLKVPAAQAPGASKIAAAHEFFHIQMSFLKVLHQLAY